MARVIRANPEDGCDAIFGRPTQAMNDFARGTIDRVARNMAEGHRVVERAKRHFRDRTVGQAARRIEAIRHKMQNTFQENRIRQLDTVGEIQQAPLEMLKFLASTPEIFRRRKEETISCWGDEYNELAPAHHEGHWNEMYRVSVDGLMINEKEDEKDNFRIYDYRKIHSTHQRLSAMERFAIQNTRNTMLKALEETVVDPTSRWNELQD